MRAPALDCAKFNWKQCISYAKTLHNLTLCRIFKERKEQILVNCMGLRGLEPPTYRLKVGYSAN